MADTKTHRRKHVRTGKGKARGRKHPYLPLVLPGIADGEWEKYAAQERGRRRSSLWWLVAEYGLSTIGRAIAWTVVALVFLVPSSVRAFLPRGRGWTVAGWTMALSTEVLSILLFVRAVT